MEWHHFEYFKQLAKLENMSETAKILNVSQSALSRAIKNLEKELGVPLFNRIGRKLKLNQYGIDFYIQRIILWEKWKYIRIKSHMILILKVGD